jgi:hypothetical protein
VQQRKKARLADRFWNLIDQLRMLSVVCEAVIYFAVFMD